MTRVLATILALMLIASPAMAHYAMSIDDHAGHVEMSSMTEDHSQHVQNTKGCMPECEEHDGKACCSSAVVHCETTVTRPVQSDAQISVKVKRLVHYYHDDARARLMPEMETPPPRI